MFMMSVPKSVFVGIEENEASLNFELSDIYPNPANSLAQLNVRLQDNAGVSVNLVNIIGQSVQMFNYGLMNAGDHQIRLDVSGIPAGIYIIELRAGIFKETKKIIILD